jgi:hypothetical protein
MTRTSPSGEPPVAVMTDLATFNSPLTVIGGNATDLFCDSKSQIAGSANISNATIVQCTNLLPDIYVGLP